jgi:hypothetical protein
MLVLWNFCSDPMIVDREYLKDNGTGMILMNGIMNGTHDESSVVPATGKVFEIPLAEFILWDDREHLGGYVLRSVESPRRIRNGQLDGT